MNKFEIRPYVKEDLPALYTICLQTANHGGDATHLIQDPDLPGNIFVGPYVKHEPDMCFVLAHAGEPCGYILGTLDSKAFYAWCEREWFPPLRKQYANYQANHNSPEMWMIPLIQAGFYEDAGLEEYPAHLHIDMLPIAQGQGWGRKLIQAFTGRLKELGIPGVHLGAGKGNEGAVRFYDRVGFERLVESQWSVVFGMKW